MNTGIRFCLFGLAAAVLAGGAWYGYKAGVLDNLFQKQEQMLPLQFNPLSGAHADRAVFEAQSFAADYVSTSQPTQVEEKIFPLTHFSTAELGHRVVLRNSDSDIGATRHAATGARIVRFANSELCDAEGRCPMGIFVNAEDDTNDFARPLIMLHARDIEVSTRTTNGNPDLIVDYGPPMGKRRVVWTTDHRPVPEYDDAGPFVE